MPGDSQSLTIPGIQESLPTVNRSKFTVQEASNETCAECKSYEVGMHVSRGMDTKVSQEIIVRGIEKVIGINVQRPRYAEGMPSD